MDCYLVFKDRNVEINALNYNDHWFWVDDCYEKRSYKDKSKIF